MITQAQGEAANSTMPTDPQEYESPEPQVREVLNLFDGSRGSLAFDRCATILILPPEDMSGHDGDPEILMPVTLTAQTLVSIPCAFSSHPSFP
eukprot:767398-Hanusia_phi.AAC.1